MNGSHHFHPHFIVYLILIGIAFVVAAVEFDNRVTGTPIVECERDFIKVTVPTLKPFKGKVFVKGAYSNKDCVKYYGSMNKNNNNNNNNNYQTYGSNGGSGGSDSSSSTFSQSQGSSNSGVNSRFGGSGNRNNGNSNSQTRGGSGSQNNQGNGIDGLNSGTFDHKSLNSNLNNGEENSFENSNSESGFLSSKPSHRPMASSKTIFNRKTSGNNNNKNPFSSNNNNNNNNNYQGLSSSSSPNDKERPLYCPPCEKCLSNTRKNTVFLDDSFTYENNNDGLLHIINPRRNRRASNSESTSSAALEIKLGTCNARRDRTINPAGIHVSFTVVVNFHENFITKVDKAYHIACSYEEADRSVATQIDVSPPPETQLQGQIEPPKCQYNIKSTNGKSISHVLVGESVEHIWHCISPNGFQNVHKVYGLLVHNCFIEDGQGKREKIIDDQGCSIDSLVIGTPEYSTKELSASIKALVVKFPDKDFVDFQCAIHMCVKADGHCDGITPPNCGASRPRRHIDPSNVTVFNEDEWKLHAQRLTVMDIDSKITNSDMGRLFLAQSSSSSLDSNNSDDSMETENLCVSVLHFGLLIASSTFLLTVSLTVLIGLMFMKNNTKVSNY